MTNPLDQVTDAINSRNRLRVWSVIITFFGDAVLPRGGAVSARTVQDVVGRLGIEPGAIRTAFSRLTRDGWVIREKQGRSSFYRLSPEELDLFGEASIRIYEAPSAGEEECDQWIFAVSKSDFSNPTFVNDTSDRSIAKLEAEDHLILEGNIRRMPTWFKQLNAPEDQAEGFQQLISDFEPALDKEFSPLDALAMRILLIHEWRRLLLQHPAAAAQIRPDDWPETRCRALVKKLYHQLLGSSEKWLSENATAPDGVMPDPETDLGQRFC